MRLYYKSRKLDFQSGGEPTVVMREKEAENHGIMPGDRVALKWRGGKSLIAVVQFTNSKVEYGEVGLFREIWQKRQVANGDVVEIALESRPESINAINKKLLGHQLSYREIKSIIADISLGKLGGAEIAFYVASSFLRPYDENELYYVTKAMAGCGEKINLHYSAVDKHSIGGIPGNRTTMIVIPIIASLGLYIPKTSSRAITAPSGTADTMEVLATVDLPIDKVRTVIKKTNACLVWGGSVNMAPADDRIIRISKPLAMEPYDKMIISIMAKKVAMGVDYLVIDLPYGQTAKIHSLKTAKIIADKFVRLGRRFKIKTKVILTKAEAPVGAGIGPALEARDVLRVLQRHPLRPLDLEEKSIILAGELLELKKYCPSGHGQSIAHRQLESLAAWHKMRDIIAAQGGQSDIRADELALGALNYEIHAKHAGLIKSIDNYAIKNICVNLGAPQEKLAGLHLHCHLGDRVAKGQKLFTLYASSDGRLDLGILAAKNNEVVKISG